MDDLTGVRQQFRWLLQALAIDAEAQLSLFPDFVLKADELALDFDHWFSTARSLLAAELSEEQMEALSAIDARLEAMSRGGPDFEEGLWSDAALVSSPQWAEIRSLARAALRIMGWPLEVPPSGRAVYVTGRASDARRADAPSPLAASGADNDPG
ncbi:MAG: hypothetical protein U0790_08785 [Isosphaeraceae bacterium]